MRDLDRLIQMLESANGDVVSEPFAADCRQAAGLLKLLRSSGVMSIARERERQVSEEGWSPAHDDQHDRGEIAIAAACYIAPTVATRVRLLPFWPWSREWWRPKDRLRDLERGGALTAAEIDRLLRRAEAAEAQRPGSDPYPDCGRRALEEATQ